MFERIQRAAENHKDKVQKYGVIGLFAIFYIEHSMRTKTRLSTIISKQRGAERLPRRFAPSIRTAGTSPA